MRIFLFISVFFISFFAFSQGAVSVGSKYQEALNFLKMNVEMNQEIKSFHNRWLKKEKLGKHEKVQFNLSKYIKFLPFPDLKEGAKEEFLKISKEPYRLYREKYYFDTEEHKVFEGLLPETESKIYLVFSKPTDNYLIAEFLIKSTPYEIDLIGHPTGPAMNILFVFDEQGKVEDYYTSYSYYN